MTNAIPLLYALLAIVVPLIFFPGSSELFEFNKIIAVYIFTVLIVFFWIIKMIIAKRFIFRRTKIDLPLLIFLGVQILSAVFSIDPHTSIFGFYSRFNGGVLSLISFALLYWAYVSNIDSAQNRALIKINLFTALIISIYAIFEHFGYSFSCLLVRGKFNVDCWVQDVQNRVFATLGQPNWLATWLISLIPITWALGLNLKSYKSWLWLILSSIFFAALLFTKSRAGLLGFLIADFGFLIAVVITNFNDILPALKSGVSPQRRMTYQRSIHPRSKLQGILECCYKTQILKIFFAPFVIYNLGYFFLAILIGTPWTPNIKELTNSRSANPIAIKKVETTNLPALEVGGTESGEIRKLVWKGALNTFLANPILGTGPETFAYAFYKYRPTEHNLVSEWDFLYNKAHNEYLNYLANTGLLGLLAFLFFLLICLRQIISLNNFGYKNVSAKSELSEVNILNLALLAGILANLTSIFFGFSTVATNLQLFLLPGVAVALIDINDKKHQPDKAQELSGSQKVGILLIFILNLSLLYSIYKYWYADYLYSKGKVAFENGEIITAVSNLNKAIYQRTSEPLYHDKLAQTYLQGSLVLLNNNEATTAASLVKSSEMESQVAISLSPANVNLKRDLANNYIQLGAKDPKYLVLAINELNSMLPEAPNDPKIFYSLGLLYARIKNEQKAIDILKKAIQLKADYRNPRLALALVYIGQGEKEAAKQQLRYILEKIDPKDPVAKAELDKLN